MTVTWKREDNCWSSILKTQDASSQGKRWHSLITNIKLGLQNAGKCWHPTIIVNYCALNKIAESTNGITVQLTVIQTNYTFLCLLLYIVSDILIIYIKEKAQPVNPVQMHSNNCLSDVKELIFIIHLVLVIDYYSWEFVGSNIVETSEPNKMTQNITNISLWSHAITVRSAKWYSVGMARSKHVN